jgi:hypothetical protein
VTGKLQKCHFAAGTGEMAAGAVLDNMPKNLRCAAKK